MSLLKITQLFSTTFGGSRGRMHSVCVVVAGVFASTVLSLSLVGGASGQTGDEIDEAPNGVPYVAGELIVTYTDTAGGVAPQGLSTPPVVEEAGGEVVETLPAVGSQVVEFPAPDGTRGRGGSLEETRREVEASPAVESADYNYLREVAAPPNDASFDRQWNLKKVAAPVAWREATGTRASTGDPASIAVIDTGADSDHPDLEGKILKTTNTAEDGGSAEETQEGHGTHVAGIAAANTDNEIGVAGACPDCDLLIAKVKDNEGYITSDAVIEAINWSADENADVINVSLSGEGAVEAERRAVNRAVEKGSTVVAAAGNASSNIKSYPAAYKEAISVAATTRQDTRAGYSNFGNWIDISAPGVAFSTVPDGEYGTKRGTSMSSPLVAGVAALISAEEDLSPAGIERRLTSTTVDLGARGKDAYFGSGRLDAAAAVGARERNTFPTISGRAPKPNATTRGRTVTLAATVRDAQTDPKKSNIRFFVDGRKKGFDFNDRTGRLTRKATFAPGRHKVKVVVGDGWGLSTKSKWSFKVPR